MDTLTIPQLHAPLLGKVPLVGSKSESNRLLIIQALARYQSQTKITIDHLSQAQDTITLQSLLQDPTQTVLDVNDAGTAMRFLTAFCAITQQRTTLTGTERMCQRPIGPLVNALQTLGADISFDQQLGYPPISITSFAQKQKTIELKANISSQFVSALLMIAPLLPQGLTIRLQGEIISKPYIQMTIDLMRIFGVSVGWTDQTLEIPQQIYQADTYSVGSDWSSASYWYSWVACAQDSRLTLQGLKEDAPQGDKVILTLGEKIGVKSEWTAEGLLLTHQRHQEQIVHDFKDCPDLAQTIAVTCAIKGIALKMYGIESLKIKETDRIQALQNELQKMGASLTYHDDTRPYWIVSRPQPIPQQVYIKTYDDHRMAMAFAPLATQCTLSIEAPKVVRKSYPSYWDDLNNVCSLPILST